MTPTAFAQKYGYEPTLDNLTDQNRAMKLTRPLSLTYLSMDKKTGHSIEMTFFYLSSVSRYFVGRLQMGNMTVLLTATKLRSFRYGELFRESIRTVWTATQGTLVTDIPALRVWSDPAKKPIALPKDERERIEAVAIVLYAAQLVGDPCVKTIERVFIMKSDNPYNEARKLVEKARKKYPMLR